MASGLSQKTISINNAESVVLNGRALSSSDDADILPTANFTKEILVHIFATMEEYPFFYSKRFLVGILAFFGEMNIFTLRGNLNIAILDMTRNHTITVGNTTITREPEFDWDSKTIGFVLGMYAYGSILSPVGGHLAMKYGGATVIGISSLIISILTMLNPIILRTSFYLFILARIIEGITECFRFVSFPELWTQWSPIRDRSKLMAITLSGLYAGPALAYPIFGYLTQNYGWPSSFYWFGGFSMVWTALWFLLVPNCPELDKWISKEEIEYIRQDPHQSRPKNLKSMWKNMLLSKQVYALGVTRMIQDFGLVVTVTLLPSYIQDLTGSDIKKVGFYSAIPTVINIFTIPCVGYLLDYFTNNGYLTITQAHKLLTCSALLFGGIILLAISFLSGNFIALMVCFTLIKTSVSVVWIICNLNIIALAPKCSSVLASFISFFHMLGSSIAPLIITSIVTDHQLSQWNTSFYTFGVISFCGAIIFFLFGSGQPQPWSYSIEHQKSSTIEEVEENKTLTHSD